MGILFAVDMLCSVDLELVMSWSLSLCSILTLYFALFEMIIQNFNIPSRITTKIFSLKSSNTLTSCIIPLLSSAVVYELGELPVNTLIMVKFCF